MYIFKENNLNVSVIKEMKRILFLFIVNGVLKVIENGV